MKKLLSKMRKKQPEAPKGRITTDTLAEHREQVLAGGRKFKYPVQYQRHRLVITAVSISVAAVILLVVLGWYLLYVAKSTSEFMYRVTKVVPVPVAVIDGQAVRYSDYLMKYRSAAHYLVEKEQIDTSSANGKGQLAYIQSQALDDAIADAYAVKLARELDVEVTDADLEAFLKQQRQSSDGEVSENTYNTVIRDYYGWSPSEYREAMKSKLLRQKVAYAVDKDAEAISKSIEEQVKAGTVDLNAIATQLNAENNETVMYAAPELVPKTNQDGGLAAAAAKLSNGQVSSAIKTTSGNGYYYVRLIDSTDTQVQYEYIHVPLKKFDDQLAKIESDKKLSRLVTIEEAEQTTEQQ